MSIAKLQRQVHLAHLAEKFSKFLVFSSPEQPSRLSQSQRGAIDGGLARFLQQVLGADVHFDRIATQPRHRQTLKQENRVGGRDL